MSQNLPFNILIFFNFSLAERAMKRLTTSAVSVFCALRALRVFARFVAVNYHFSSQHYSRVSSRAKDFIARLLVRDMRRRATAEDCL